MNPLAWTCQLPDNWEAKPLRSAAAYVVSNVDKLSDDDEAPVRLCNYTDVYNNEFITPALDFMHATASEAEIEKFGLSVDVAIENDARGTSASMVKISQEHIKNWWIPVPPIAEQRSIVAALACQTQVIDKARAIIERTIALINERRSALIAAAVARRIDARTTS